jgi:arsenate reductase
LERKQPLNAAAASQAAAANSVICSFRNRKALAMTDRIYNVLFLCTANSSRSIFAESILQRDGRGRFRAFSAGSHPRGFVNPFTLEVLADYHYPATGFRSKSWEEFAAPGAPAMDFVFTVCDDAAGETCPVWPGLPMTAHWGIEDPAKVEGVDLEKKKAFVSAFRYLKNRISVFAALPLASIDKLALASRLNAIGEMEGSTSARARAS